MDRQRLSALPRLRPRSVQGVFRALVRQPQSAARRLLDDTLPAAAQHLAELLHPRSPRCLGRLSDLCPARTIMMPDRPRFTLIARDAGARLSAFARDVRAGLTAQPKTLSCCYFYDAEGSQLFDEICQLDEYYLTRAE